MVTSGSFQNLIQELKRRRVFRVATLYVVSMWPIIQIVDILSPALNLPDVAMRNLLILFIAGFPMAIGLAWLYNLTPKGVIKNSEDDSETPERLIGKKLEIGLIASFVLIAVVLVSFQDQWFEDTPSDVTQKDLTLDKNNTASVINETANNKPIESIAVLPFVPFSEDKEDEFFADGLAEELLNVLAKIKSLRVAARTSSFAYKGTQSNIQEIGNELGVDVILEGSVRRNDISNSVRVTAQLIDVKSGTHLWSDTYERQFQDIFRIQDEITEAVVSELKITLLGKEKQQLMAHDTASPEAMADHSRGRTELAKRTAASVLLATNYFQKAIEADAQYATAYASLAEAYVLSVSYADKPKKEYLQLAQESVDKALIIDEKLGLAWAAQGLIYFSDNKKGDKAREALEKAIELNPSYAMAYMWYGSLQDDFDKKAEYHEKAFQLDPKSPVAGFNVAMNLLDKGKDREAMKVFSKIVDADPFYPGAYQLVAMINQFNGRVDQAIINYKKSYDLGGSSKSAGSLAQLYIDMGNFKEAEQWMKILSEDNSGEYDMEIQWMKIAIMLGKKEYDQVKDNLSKIVGKQDKEIMLAMNQVTANYILEDFPATIKSYENAKAIAPEWQQKIFESGKWLDSLIYVSYAYQQLEKEDESQSILQKVKEHRESMKLNGFRTKPFDWYLQSLIEIIEGKPELAIVSLQRAVDQGWMQSWRIESEHVLKTVMEKPEFKEVLQSLHTRINIMRENLAFEQKFTSVW